MSRYFFSFCETLFSIREDGGIISQNAKPRGGTSVDNVIGKRIKSLRQAEGMTQKELASKLSISNTTLSQYESGARVPSDDIKLKIARLFGVTTDYLLDERTSLPIHRPLALTEEEVALINEHRGAKGSPLTTGQGDKIIQKALAGSGLLSADGSLPPESEELISDFLAQNATILKKLLKDGK